MNGPYDEMIGQMVEALEADEPPDKDKLCQTLTEELDRDQKNSFDYLWEYSARQNQLPPPGDWRVWMIMAGRGFGKTRAGAEWVRMIADANPDARIALVSSSLAEARAVMVEGASGLLAICRPGHKPVYEPSLHRLRFRNGAQAQLFSAAEPEALRGPQHSHARGAGAEGILRQSGAQPPRRAARTGSDGLATRAACSAGGGRVLPRYRPGERGLDRPTGPDRRPHGRRLALHRAGRGPAGVRSRRRAHDGLPFAMAPRPGTRTADGRHCRGH